MTLPVQVLVVCSDPMLASALHNWVVRGAEPVQCRLVAFLDQVERGTAVRPELLVVSPQTWEEMERWRPALEARFVTARWLVRARPRVAGLFLSDLKRAPLCEITGSLGPPEQFAAAFGSLLEGSPRCPPARLVGHLCGAIARRAGRPHAPSLTMKELECACGASLGLSNARIAAVTHLAEGTVKNYRHSFFEFLHVSTREELAALVEAAAFSLPVPP